MLSLYLLIAPLRTQGSNNNVMEETFKKIIRITEELLDPNCNLEDRKLINKLKELESLMEQVDKSGKWDETNFTYNDRCYTEGVIKPYATLRKRITIEEFYKRNNEIQFQNFLHHLKVSIETYLQKNYNIS